MNNRNKFATTKILSKNYNFWTLFGSTRSLNIQNKGWNWYQEFRKLIRKNLKLVVEIYFVFNFSETRSCYKTFIIKYRRPTHTFWSWKKHYKFIEKQFFNIQSWNQRRLSKISWFWWKSRFRLACPQCFMIVWSRIKSTYADCWVMHILHTKSFYISLMVRYLC